MQVFVAKVVGLVISTCKEKNLDSYKLLIVRDINSSGNKTIIAADSVGAGIGETVLVVNEGGSARQAVKSEDAPFNAAIVGILDYPEKYAME